MRAHGLFAVLLLAGCGSTGVGNPPVTELAKNEQELLDDGTDSTEIGDTGAAVVAIPVITLTKPAHLVDADTSASVSELSKAFFAKDCVNTTRAANVVTYVFNNCAFGPLGLLLVNGTLSATFTAKPAGAMEIVIKNEGAPLSVNRATVTMNATALVSFVGDTRKVVWNGAAKVNRPLKEDVDHQSSYESTYDGTCVALDGSAKSVIGPRNVESAVTGYKRCGPRSACPSAGKITYSATGRPTITIEFLGGKRARITIPKGTVEITMKCEG